ncbi:MAG TPA: hypothetical protein VH413_16270 [Verrucomicrobiae bacterium]|jgi:hypothetical protein|nr:hypothetical protein [Verrucomicrobiae bacterium]
MDRIKQAEFWIYSLLSAFITGGCSAMGSDESVSLAQRFGAHVEALSLKQMGAIFIVGGITGAVAYLKKSPLPPLAASAEREVRSVELGKEGKEAGAGTRPPITPAFLSAPINQGSAAEPENLTAKT